MRLIPGLQNVPAEETEPSGLALQPRITGRRSAASPREYSKPPTFLAA